MVYFFVQGSPLQFKICAVFQLSVDIGKCSGASLWLNPNRRLVAIVLQRLHYGNALPSTALGEEDDLEQALALAEE